jgi:hypothetical protein
MRKLIFTVVLACISMLSTGQGKTLYHLTIVNPRLGSTTAFETAWKAHLLKYHKGDDKRSVFEILSGDHAGKFQLVSGPSAFADMDKEKSTDAAHDQDYDKTVVPSVQDMSGSYVYRHADTLSYNGDVVAEKFFTTVYNVRRGKMNDFTAEVKRAVATNKLINSRSSYNSYIRLWSGTSPQLVIVSRLKDGFKQMDDAFAPSQSAAFKEQYIKSFGQEQWEKRMTSITDFVESTEVFISKLRKDLSSAL